MVEIEIGSRISIWRTFVFQKRKYISAVNWVMSTKFGLLIDFDLLKAVTATNTKPEVVFSGRGHHLEKWIWRHIFAISPPIWMQFGSLMQNNMQITAKWSRSKPEVEFQYGGRLFFKNGSSYISAVNWDMSSKFGLLIRLWPSEGRDTNKCATESSIYQYFSTRTCSVRNKHETWRYISAMCALIWTKFGFLVQNNMQITAKWSRAKPEEEFQYGGRLFL